MKIPAFHHPLLALVATLLLASTANAEPPLPPLKAERFSDVPAKELAKYIPTTAVAGVQKIITERGCAQENMTGYRSRKSDTKSFVVTVQCYPPPGLKRSDNRYRAYIEYPLTMVVQGDLIKEVDFRGHEFMYQSGRIAFVTDIDGNDMPEFLLFGDVCECDGGPEYHGPKGCDCNGGSVVEFRNGDLQPWERPILPRPSKSKRGA